MRTLARKIVAASMATVLLVSTGCVRKKDDPLRLVIAVDATLSIERPAEEEAFNSIERSMQSLGRGDAVVVIPITGDAWNDSQRAIVREHLPEEREPYDADRRRFSGRVRSALEAMRAGVMKEPAQSTDILGAVDVAAEEIADRAVKKTPDIMPPVTRALIIISDFIQDDTQFDFETDSRLADSQRARQLALKLAEARGSRFEGVKVYLGYLASVDGRNLSSDRRDAIEAFWTAYLAAQGAEVEWAIDGPGRLPQFLADLQENAAPATPALARFFSCLRPERFGEGGR
jgi:hypothetical protein